MLERPDAIGEGRVGCIKRPPPTCCAPRDIFSLRLEVVQVGDGVPAVPEIGGNQIGEAGCVGTNRPSFGGNSGSTSAQSCGAVLSFQGPQIGQVASAIGPTIIGSVVMTPINTTNGAITTVGYP